MSPIATPGQGLPLPRGFRAHTGHAGLRPSGDDVAVVLADRSCPVAGVFTRSRFAGPSVALSREVVASGRARAAVVVAKNANVATGEQGRRDAAEVVRTVGSSCGIDPAEVVLASTGVIGRRYPMGTLGAHLGSLRPERFGADALDLARAMMTTDTVPKTTSVELSPGGARVVGVAKGVGMIEPDMATLLALVLTDAAVAPGPLDGMWRRAVDSSFNCLSIDTDTSTSDTAVVMASGEAGAVPEQDLEAALAAACLDLTLQVAADGEGATKVLTVSVGGARDHDQARRVAKTVVNSPLVKTAVHGADPNWGRVAMAVGKCSGDVDVDPDLVTISFGGVESYPRSMSDQDLEALRKVLSAARVDIGITLGIGEGMATVYGCDLSAGYVSINADYTT